ncbi:MAG TPA: hypothetical protein DCL49_11740, partial [Candidatus Omnitrophica bacterium]|nr:hypothetical protein [Candidatus Omnitrophota bacterium]
MTNNNNTQTELGLEDKPQMKEPEFQSKFKPWLRAVAFIVVAVFLPEQVSWAIEYDWRPLWPKTAGAMGLLGATNMASSYSPSYTNTKGIYAQEIPEAIKKILQDIANKPITSLQLSPTLSIELKEPLKLNARRIEEIYNWLKGKPCGAKALHDFLNYQGIKAEEQDIAVLVLSTDILNNVIKPEGNPSVIKNSLYALSKASEFFGKKLIPVKVDLHTSTLTNLHTPFIAHFKGDHYILVTRITDEKIYFSDEHREEFLPKEKFLEKFSGYALIPAQEPYSAIADKEAMEVMGAGWGGSDWDDDFGNNDYTANYNYYVTNNYAPAQSSYAGYSTAAGNLNSQQLNYSRPTAATGGPIGFDMVRYGPNGLPSSVYREVSGFHSEYTNDAYKTVSTIDYQLPATVYAHYDSQGTLDSATYQGSDISRQAQDYQTMPYYAQNKVQYADSAKNPALYSGSVGGNMAVWIGKHINDLSFVARTSGSVAWDLDPMGKQILNPEAAAPHLGEGGPNLPAEFKAVQHARASELAGFENTSIRLFTPQDGTTLRLTNMGLSVNIGDKLSGAIGKDLIPGLTFTTKAKNDYIQILPSTGPGRSLTFGLGGRTEITNSAGLKDMERVASGVWGTLNNTSYALARIPLNSEKWTIKGGEDPILEGFYGLRNASVGKITGDYGRLDTTIRDNKTNKVTHAYSADIVELLADSHTGKFNAIRWAGITGLSSSNIPKPSFGPRDSPAQKGAGEPLQRKYKNLNVYQAGGYMYNPDGDPETIELAGTGYLGVSGQGIDFSPMLIGRWNIPGGKLDLWDKKLEFHNNNVGVATGELMIKLGIGRSYSYSSPSEIIFKHMRVASPDRQNENAGVLSVYTSKDPNIPLLISHYKPKTGIRWDKDYNSAERLISRLDLGWKKGQGGQIEKIEEQHDVILNKNKVYALPGDHTYYVTLLTDKKTFEKLSSSNNKNSSRKGDSLESGNKGEAFSPGKVSRLQVGEVVPQSLYKITNKMADTGVQVAEFNLSKKGTDVDIKDDVLFSPGMEYTAEKGMKEWVVAAQVDDKGNRVGHMIAAAHREYKFDNFANKTNPDLAKAGSFSFGSKGFVLGSNKDVKSGWVNMSSWASGFIEDANGHIEFLNEETGKITKGSSYKMLLEGVSFWANEDSNNNIIFSAPRLTGAKVSDGRTMKALEKVSAVVDNGKFVIQTQDRLPLILARTAKLDKLDDNSADDKTAVTPNFKSNLPMIKMIISPEGGKNIASQQRVEFLIDNLASPYANLSGHFHNINGKAEFTGTKLDVALAVQIAKKGPTAVGGVTFFNDDSLVGNYWLSGSGVMDTRLMGSNKDFFNRIGLLKDTTFTFTVDGSLEGNHAGFWKGVKGQTYTSLYQNEEGQKALAELKGEVRWNKKGELISGEKSFLRLMTKADKGRWYNITGRESGIDGSFSITTEAGKYTVFNGSSDNSKAAAAQMDEMAVSSRRIAKYTLDKDKNWIGQSSFFLNGFKHNFQGNITQDFRNYEMKQNVFLKGFNNVVGFPGRFWKNTDALGYAIFAGLDYAGYHLGLGGEDWREYGWRRLKEAGELAAYSVYLDKKFYGQDLSQRVSKYSAFNILRNNLVAGGTALAGLIVSAFEDPLEIISPTNVIKRKLWTETLYGFAKEVWYGRQVDPNNSGKFIEYDFDQDMYETALQHYGSYGGRAIYYTERAAEIYLMSKGTYGVMGKVGLTTRAGAFWKTLAWTEATGMGSVAIADFYRHQAVSSGALMDLTVSFALPFGAQRVANSFGRVTKLLTAESKIAEGLTGFRKVAAMTLATSPNMIKGNLALGHFISTAANGRPMNLGDSVGNIVGVYAFQGGANAISVGAKALGYGSALGKYFSPATKWPLATYPAIGAAGGFIYNRKQQGNEEKWFNDTTLESVLWGAVAGLGAAKMGRIGHYFVKNYNTIPRLVKVIAQYGGLEVTGIGIGYVAHSRTTHNWKKFTVEKVAAMAAGGLVLGGGYRMFYTPWTKAAKIGAAYIGLGAMGAGTAYGIKYAATGKLNIDKSTALYMVTGAALAAGAGWAGWKFGMRFSSVRDAIRYGKMGLSGGIHGDLPGGLLAGKLNNFIYQSSYYTGRFSALGAKYSAGVGAGYFGHSIATGNWTDFTPAKIASMAAGGLSIGGYRMLRTPWTAPAKIAAAFIGLGAAGAGIGAGASFTRAKVQGKEWKPFDKQGIGYMVAGAAIAVGAIKFGPRILPYIQKVNIAKAFNPELNRVLITYPVTGAGGGLVYNRISSKEWFGENWVRHTLTGAGIGLLTAGGMRGATYSDVYKSAKAGVLVGFGKKDPLSVYADIINHPSIYRISHNIGRLITPYGRAAAGRGILDGLRGFKDAVSLSAKEAYIKQTSIYNTASSIGRYARFPLMAGVGSGIGAGASFARAKVQGKEWKPFDKQGIGYMVAGAAIAAGAIKFGPRILPYIQKVNIAKAFNPELNRVLITYPMIGAGSGLVYNRISSKEWFGKNWGWHTLAGAGIGLTATGVIKASYTDVYKSAKAGLLDGLGKTDAMTRYYNQMGFVRYLSIYRAAYNTGRFAVMSKGVAVYGALTATGAGIGYATRYIKTGKTNLDREAAVYMGIGALTVAGGWAGARYGKQLFPNMLNFSKSEVIKYSKLAYNRAIVPVRDNFVKTIGLDKPLNFLAASTFAAAQDFKYSRLTENGYTSPLADIGVPGYLLGILLSPGRTMIASVGNGMDFIGMPNDLNSAIAGIRNRSQYSFLTFINKIGDKIGGYQGSAVAFALAAPAYVDAFLNSASGATQIYALSNPKKFISDFTELWNVKNLITPGVLGDVKAKGGEFGAIFWSMLGYSRGFKYNAKLIREATQAQFKITETITKTNGEIDRIVLTEKPIEVWFRGEGATPFAAKLVTNRPLYSQLSDVQKLGFFFARTNEQAASFVKVNTMMSLGLSTLNANDNNKLDVLVKSAAKLAYEMPIVASSAFGMTLSFNVLGNVYGKIANSRMVRNMGDSSTLRFFSGDYARTPKWLPVDVKMGKIITPTVLIGSGAGMYYEGMKLNKALPDDKFSLLGNYLEIGGLALMGAGLWSAGYNMKKSALFSQPNSWLNRMVGANVKGWELARYNIAYGIGGAAAGVAYGIYKDEIKGFKEWKDIKGILAYGGTGAVAGMFGLRKVPSIVPWAVETAGHSALIWAAKKGVIDPAISGIEALLDERKTFDIRETTYFKLTSWEKDHQAKRYVEPDIRKDLKPEEIYELKEHIKQGDKVEQGKKSYVEQLLSDRQLAMLKDQGINFDNLKIDSNTNYIFNKADNGKYIRLPEFKSIYYAKLSETELRQMNVEELKEMALDNQLFELAKKDKETLINGLADKFSYRKYEKSGEKYIPKMVSDLPAAIGYGLLTRAAIIGFKKGYEAYTQGKTVKSLGYREGLKQAFYGVYEAPGKSGSVKAWYNFGAKNPLVGIGSMGVAAGGTLWTVGYFKQSKELKNAGMVIGGIGAAVALAGLARAASLRSLGYEKAGQAYTHSAIGKLSGGALAFGKAAMWDFGAVRTGWNLATVIAPLAGAVEGASLLTKTYLMPSASTNFEHWLLGSTLGAFWITPEDAQRFGDMSLASRKKYDGLIEKWNNANGLTDKMTTGLGFAGLAYSAGLWGQHLRQDLEQPIREIARKENLKDWNEANIQDLVSRLGDKVNAAVYDLRIIAGKKGYAGADMMNAEQLVSRIAGTAKVGSLLAKDGWSLSNEFKANWKKVEKSNIYFSLALAVAGPLANSVFPNIKMGGFGKTFQAAAEGWEAGLKSVFPSAVVKAAAQKTESKFMGRLYNFSVGGTAEELIPENIIQLGLNLIPFNGPWAQQIYEVIQEITTPNGGLRALNANDLHRMLMNKARIVGLDLVSRRDLPGIGKDAGTKAKELANKLQNATRQDLRNNNGELFKEIGEVLVSGDKIIVDDGGELRTITVEEGPKWNEFWAIRQKVVEFNDEKTYDVHKLNEFSTRSSDTIIKEAAGRALAGRVNDERMIAGALTKQGVIVINDKTGSSPIEIEAKYLVEEKMAFDRAFRQNVLNALENMPTSEYTVNDITFRPMQADAHAVRNGKIHTLDRVKFTKTSEFLMPQLQKKTLGIQDMYARYLETGNEFYANRASFMEQEVNAINKKIGREELLSDTKLLGAKRGLDDSSFARRALFYTNYYTLAKIGLNAGKAGAFKKNLKEVALKDNALVKTSLMEIERERKELEKEKDKSILKEKTEELDKKEKRLKKMQKARIGLGEAFNLHYEQMAHRQLYGYDTGGLTRAMALDKIDAELRSGADTQRGTLLQNARAKVEKALAYDVKTVTNLMLPLYSAEEVFGDEGRLTIQKLAPHISMDELRKFKMYFTEYGQLRNEATKAMTSAKNQGTHIDVDIFQNVRFSRDGNTVAITPNATGIFNVGAGAHEFIHALLAGKFSVFSPSSRRNAYNYYRQAVDNLKSRKAAGEAAYKDLTDRQIRQRAYQQMRFNPAVGMNLMGKQNAYAFYRQAVDTFKSRKAAGEEGYKDLTDRKIRKIAYYHMLTDKNINNYRISALKIGNPAFSGLLDLLAQNAGVDVNELEMNLSEMNDNEVFTQFLSARYAAQYIRDNPRLGVQTQLNNALTDYFVKLGQKSGVDVSGGSKGIIGAIADMDDKELMRVAYKYVKGSQTYKTEAQRELDRQAAEVHREAMQFVKQEVNANPDYYNREQKIMNLFEWKVEDLAKQKGYKDVRVVRSLSSVSSGPNTAVVDWSGKKFGRYLQAGDEVTIDAVVKVGDSSSHGTYDAASTLVAVKENGRMQLKDINPFRELRTTNPDGSNHASIKMLSENEFRQQISGLRKTQRRAHWITYQAMKAALDGLLVVNGKRGFSDYGDWEEAVANKMQETDKRYRRFAHDQKIHELQGSEELHSFKLGHFQDRSELKGLINIGDVLSIEPFVALPGKFGVRREIQVRITKDGYDFITDNNSFVKNSKIDKDKSPDKSPTSLVKKGDILAWDYILKAKKKFDDGDFRAALAWARKATKLAGIGYSGTIIGGDSTPVVATAASSIETTGPPQALNLEFIRSTIAMEGHQLLSQIYEKLAQTAPATEDLRNQSAQAQEALPVFQTKLQETENLIKLYETDKVEAQKDLNQLKPGYEAKLAKFQNLSYTEQKAKEEAESLQGELKSNRAKRQAKNSYQAHSKNTDKALKQFNAVKAPYEQAQVKVSEAEGLIAQLGLERSALINKAKEAEHAIKLAKVTRAKESYTSAAEWSKERAYEFAKQTVEDAQKEDSFSRTAEGYYGLSVAQGILAQTAPATEDLRNQSAQAQEVLPVFQTKLQETEELIKLYQADKVKAQERLDQLKPGYEAKLAK